MARARGEHRPYVAFTLPGPGACTACQAWRPVRTAVILPAHVGCLRALLCDACVAAVEGALWGTHPGDHCAKRCPHCARVWPRSPVAWHRNRTTRDGLEAWCKVCKAGDARARRRRRSWRAY